MALDPKVVELLGLWEQAKASSIEAFNEKYEAETKLTWREHDCQRLVHEIAVLIRGPALVIEADWCSYFLHENILYRVTRNSLEVCPCQM